MSRRRVVFCDESIPDRDLIATGQQGQCDEIVRHIQTHLLPAGLGQWSIAFDCDGTGTIHMDAHGHAPIGFRVMIGDLS